MKKTIKTNTVGYINDEKFTKGDHTLLTGLFLTAVGVACSAVGYVVRETSYRLYVTDNTHEVKINIDANKK